MCNYSTANKQFFFFHFFSSKFISQEITCRIAVVIFLMFILEFYCPHLFREKLLTLTLRLKYSLWSEVQLHIKKIVKCDSCWPFDVIYHEGKIIFYSRKALTAMYIYNSSSDMVLIVSFRSAWNDQIFLTPLVSCFYEWIL